MFTIIIFTLSSILVKLNHMVFTYDKNIFIVNSHIYNKYIDVFFCLIVSFYLYESGFPLIRIIQSVKFQVGTSLEKSSIKNRNVIEIVNKSIFSA